VEFHGLQLCFGAYRSIPSRLRLPEGPREGNGFECVSSIASN
jgi:hypothetical protein